AARAGEAAVAAGLGGLATDAHQMRRARSQPPGSVAPGPEERLQDFERATAVDHDLSQVCWRRFDAWSPERRKPASRASFLSTATGIRTWTRGMTSRLTRQVPDT